MNEIPEGTMCSNCKKRPATIWWTGHASPVEVCHGVLQEPWCDVCATEAQLEYCRMQADRIPKLEARLKELMSV